MDELDKLAAKGREAAKSPDRAARAEADLRTYLAQRIVTESLGAAHATRFAPAVVGGTCVVLAGIAAVIGDPDLTMVAYPVLIAVGLVGSMVAWRWSEGRALQAGVAWMKGLPWAFDASAYLDLLAGARMNTRLRVEIQFAESPPQADYPNYLQACKGAVETEDVEWRGSVLHVRSGSIPSYFAPRDGDSYYRNHMVHLWVRTLLDSAVAAMHARTPVKRVRVKLLD